MLWSHCKPSYMPSYILALLKLYIRASSLVVCTACQAAGTGMMLSSWATSTIEEVMSAMSTSGPGGVLWLQLYIYKDRELTLSLVRRAEEAGYKGIFVTVDTPYLGRRWDDMRNRFKLPSHLR